MWAFVAVRMAQESLESVLFARENRENIYFIGMDTLPLIKQNTIYPFSPRVMGIKKLL